MQSVPVLMAKFGFRPSPKQLPVPTPELMENSWFSSSPELGPRWSTVRDHFNNFFLFVLFKMSPQSLKNFIYNPRQLKLNSKIRKKKPNIVLHHLLEHYLPHQIHMDLFQVHFCSSNCSRTTKIQI